MWNIDASLIVHVVIFQAHLEEFLFSNVYIFGDSCECVWYRDSPHSDIAAERDGSLRLYF